MKKTIPFLFFYPLLFVRRIARRLLRLAVYGYLLVTALLLLFEFYGKLHDHHLFKYETLGFALLFYVLGEAYDGILMLLNPTNTELVFYT